MKQKSSLRFSLDIGTRKVLGLLTEEHGSVIRVRYAARREHEGRSMLDGQIHNIPEVGRVLIEVKEELEKKAGVKLMEAAVAAAGRALRTARGKAEVVFGTLSPVRKEQIRALEWEAVSDAQERLASELRTSNEQTRFHCVAYSVLRYWLDGVRMANLEGQVGERVQVEVIATFLPTAVVDSLVAALDIAGLAVASLTLEPIAALKAVVKPTMRHLNLVLIDIGAGTSDIAVTRDGAVVAYAMVPEAGDEVTEELSRLYLLEFNEAEKAKRRLCREKEFEAVDVLGQNRVLRTDEVLEALGPTLDRLAGSLAEAITRINGGPPTGVMLVGGGSLTPTLPERLAKALGLDPARVAPRTAQAVDVINRGRKGLSGPDAVTPLGIALNAHRGEDNRAVVTVGERQVQVFHPGRLTVGAALQSAGVRARDLVGKPGPGLVIKVNGETKVVPGTRAKPAVVKVNGQPADLNTQLTGGEAIEILPAVDGEPPRVQVAEFMPADSLRITMNGKEVNIKPSCFVNGKPSRPDRYLRDGDTVEFRFPRMVGELVQGFLSGSRSEDAPDGSGGAEAASLEQVLSYELNGEKKEEVWPRYVFLVNGSPAENDTPVRDGDRIEWRPREVTMRVVLEQAGFSMSEPVRVTVNGSPVLIPPICELRKNGKPASLETPVEDGDLLEVLEAGSGGPLLNQLFTLVDFDPTPPRTGARLILKVNGKPARFTTPLKEGDKVDLYWDGGSSGSLENEG